MVRILHTHSVTPLSPAYDNVIARKYSARTIEHKLENKTALQADLGWIEEPKQPIVCLPTGITEANDGALFEAILPGLLELPVGIVIRGRGSKKYGELIGSLAKDSKHRIAVLPDDEESLRKMLAGSDMALFCSNQYDDVLQAALQYGCVPISEHADFLDNYSPTQESGNSFLYESPTHWQCFAAIVRALETFKFPYDWRTIQRHAIESAARHDDLVKA